MRLHSLLAAILLIGSLAGLYSGCRLGQPKTASAPAANDPNNRSKQGKPFRGEFHVVKS